MSNSMTALAPIRNANRAATADTPGAAAREPEPRWTRPAFWALLAVTAVTCLWNLGASRYANDYYAAAVQAGTRSRQGSIISAGPSTGRELGGDGAGDGARANGARADGMRRGGPGEVSNDLALTALLRDAGTKWAAAAVSAESAAGLELSSGTAVMAIGGFTGSDPAPTLEQFQAWVAQGQVHYFIASHGGPGSGEGVSAQIRTWVQQHYTATTVGGQTVYDLTRQAA